MELINNIIWVWAISFSILVIWIKRNPDFIKRIFYNDPEISLYWSYQQIELIVFIIGFLIAPLPTVIILVTEFLSFSKFVYYKMKIRLKLRGLKDPDIKRGLRKKIKNIKYKF